MISRRFGLLFFTAVALGMGSVPLRAQDAADDKVKSLKERLSDKASDEQRVNNCRVPPEKRGTKVRPDCPEPAPAATSSADQAQGEHQAE